MTNSMTDALSRLAQRMSRVVREHEVLRVAGSMMGDDPAAIARTATAEVLRWAQNRCGGRLPPEAWEHKSFEYLSGGRNSSCVRLQSNSSDIWAIRADDPDKSVAGRVWTTEVVVGLLPSRPAKFSVRQLVNTPEVDLQIEPHSPGFVQRVADTCRLVCGSQRISSEPMVFEFPEDGDDLVDQLLNPARQLPTFVFTLPRNQDRHRIIDVAGLARALLGIGHVALAHAEATPRLTEAFGKFRSVFGGGARVYLPGFTEDADPYIHRLVLANQLQTPEDAARIVRWMRQLAAQESVRRAKLGKDVLTFAAIRNAALQLRQQTLKDEDASEGAQLAAANDRVAALERQLASLASDQDYYVFEFENERARAEAAEAQAQQSAYRIQQLTDQLKQRGDDPDVQIDMPTTWAELVDWSDHALAGRLVLTPTARRGVRKPLFKDVDLTARCLLWLATEGRDRLLNGGGSISNVSILDGGAENAPCGSDAYEILWGGRSMAVDWHIKGGGNTRDPSRCLRIYYAFDLQTQQIIVSDMPAHRETDAT